MAKSRLAGILGAKREPGTYSPWPKCCGQHPNFYRLSTKARSLLLELLTQYNSANNGDLAIAWTVMRGRGWRSKDTLQKARDELLRTGWIDITQYGGLGVTELYALTFFDIDPCQGKVDQALVGKRLSFWKLGHNPNFTPKRPKMAVEFQNGGIPTPKTGTSSPDYRG